MKILYIELENFIAIEAAMKTRSVKFEFGHINKPIIQIYGPNHCGKTVLAHLLHPFSDINFNGDERNDLSLIIPGETGIKKIGYDVNGDLYQITHTYKPTKTSHTITSSILKNGEELNPSGGVSIFNQIIDKELSINKYIFQFIINGTQLTNIGTMGDTQRKNALYKAMGIDIYNAIHKMATDDYRYTSKIMTALNNSREFIVSTYGTYEAMCAKLEMKQTQYQSLSNDSKTYKSRMDELSGKIKTLKSQNINEELITLTNQIQLYEDVITKLGNVSPSFGDELVNVQIELSEKINDTKSRRSGYIKDRDILFTKRDDIQNTIRLNQKAFNDYEELKNMREDISNQIKSMKIYSIETAPSYLSNMLNLASVINSTCKEIMTSLNDKLLTTMCDMLINGIDINGFLLREGATLKDSESEKAAVHRLHNILNGVPGDIVECDITNCLYKKSYDMMKSFFSSYQSNDASSMTAYDIEQLEMAYKGILSIKRVIMTQIAEECRDLFTMESIANNMKHRLPGIDVNIINELIEQATSEETRIRLIKQLSDLDKTINSMSSMMIANGSQNEQDVVESINKEIENINGMISDCDKEIQFYEQETEKNKESRMLYSSIRNINIGDVRVRFSKLSKLSIELNQCENEYNDISNTYYQITSELQILEKDLKTIQEAYNQYNSNVAEIDACTDKNKKYKIIAEATSSTKGKPVLSIREKVNNALSLTNRLLDVMYDGDMEMLKPVIDETNFQLPFRSGTNKLSDIRYGSQSENTLLSLAFNLSIATGLTHYNIPIIDELDAFLDAEVSDSFVMMLIDIMSTLRMEQLFDISHKLQPGQYDQYVHIFDITKEVK